MADVDDLEVQIKQVVGLVGTLATGFSESAKTPAPASAWTRYGLAGALALGAGGTGIGGWELSRSAPTESQIGQVERRLLENEVLATEFAKFLAQKIDAAHPEAPEVEKSRALKDAIQRADDDAQHQRLLDRGRLGHALGDH